MLQESLRTKLNAYLGKPYQCSNPQAACVLFVLELMASCSPEFAQILERVKTLDIGHNKRRLIRQDYLRKFIRTTRLKPVPLADLSCGDILLISEYSRDQQIDHVGLYLGQGEYVHIRRDKNKGDWPEILNLDANRERILGAVRGINSW
ncbi:MAG: C40 family peptidase [Candidatus Schekmanbacteria bacterium]|nr:C40 family peptidase [Candidatus Schekmanbacteria bacterium]